MRARFEITVRDIRLERWQTDSVPLRVVHLSDLHFKGMPKRGHLLMAEWVHRFAPDMILLTGDLVSRPWAWRGCVRWLSTLPAAPVRVSVPGNWDYHFHQTYRDFEMRMKAVGYTALRNESMIVNVGDTTITIVGIDDPRRGDPDPETAFSGYDGNSPVILLVHNPDQLPELVDYPSDLILCGHTHGGQIRVPGYGAVMTSSSFGKRYEGGYYREEGRNIYVSRGVGTGNLVPVRFACPPELVCLNLYPADISGNVNQSRHKIKEDRLSNIELSKRVSHG